MSAKRLSRRDFLSLAATAAAGSVLAACTPVVVQQPAESGTTAQTAADSPAPEAEAIELSLGHHWEAAFRSVQDDWDKAFMERHPEITLNNIYNTWSDHNNVVPTWAAAGTLPDIIYVHGSRAYPWAHEGITVSIQDYVDSDTEFNAAGIWEEALKLYRYEGKQHDIPYDHGPLILAYNKDIFDAAGEPYPDDGWTLDTLREVALKLTDVDNQQWGWSGDLPALGPESSGATLGPFGEQSMNEEQTALTFDTPGAIAAMQFWADLIHVDKSAPTPAESQAFEQGAWISGRVALDVIASWDTPTMASFAAFKWDVAAWPSGSAGRGTGSFGSGFGITSNSKNPDAGWTYLSEYLSKEGMETMWGVTGRGSPARKDAYQSWMDSSVAPEHAEYFLSAMEEYARTGPPFATLAAAELLDIIGREVTLIRSGEKTVEEAVATMIEEGNAALAKVA